MRVKVKEENDPRNAEGSQLCMFPPRSTAHGFISLRAGPGLTRTRLSHSLARKPAYQSQ